MSCCPQLLPPGGVTTSCSSVPLCRQNPTGIFEDDACIKRTVPKVCYKFALLFFPFWHTRCSLRVVTQLSRSLTTARKSRCGSGYRRNAGSRRALSLQHHLSGLHNLCPDRVFKKRRRLLYADLLEENHPGRASTRRHAVYCTD